MFKSKVRPVVITQYEHGRLAGTLAQLWGNSTFAQPALDFTAFVDGVTLHDWAYGIKDNLAIGQVTEEAWLNVIRKGFARRFDHPTIDIVVKLHLQRLLSLNPSPVRRVLMSQIGTLIKRRLSSEDSGPGLETYKRADKITQLCDMISFDFCFESPRQDTLDLFAQPGSAETTKISYEIRPGGEVRVNPWPFSVPVITGILYAFQRQGYPDELESLVVQYYILPGS